MLKHRIMILISAFLIMLIFTGCAKIKFTPGLKNNIYAKYGKYTVSSEAANILFGEIKYSYETLFNDDVWNKEVDGKDINTYIKETVEDKAKYLLFLNSLADELDIELTEDELNKIDAAAEKYVQANDGNANKKAAASLYKMYLLADKTYSAITNDVDTEVSTDEARLISVQYIFKKADFENDSESAIYQKKSAMSDLHDKIKNGSDIVSLAISESDDSNYSLEFGRGEYDKDFENAAFDLEMGEVSDVIETQNGFYIIKCVNDNINTDISARKAKIVEERRQEAFNAYFSDYIKDKNVRINENYYNKNGIENIAALSGSFQQIYDDTFNY